MMTTKNMMTGKSIMTTGVGWSRGVRGFFSRLEGIMGTEALFIWRLCPRPRCHPPPQRSPASITYCHQGAHKDAHCRQLRGHALHAAHLAHALFLHIAAAHDHWGQSGGREGWRGRALQLLRAPNWAQLAGMYVYVCSCTCMYSCVGKGAMLLCVCA